MIVQKILVPLKPMRDGGGQGCREHPSHSLVQEDLYSGDDTLVGAFKKSKSSGWSMLDLGHHRYIQVEIQTSSFEVFSPHWMTCKEDVELAGDQCALETAVGNEVHRALSHVCFPNECRRVNAQQLNEQALGGLHMKPKLVLYFKNTCLFLEKK